jgi:hypothetical protein
MKSGSGRRGDRSWSATIPRSAKPSANPCSANVATFLSSRFGGSHSVQVTTIPMTGLVWV